MGQLLNSIQLATKKGDPILIGLRDRALIALMGYTFGRVGAAVQMKVEDFYIQKRRGWLRLHEKGGKVTELPGHQQFGNRARRVAQRFRPGFRADRSPVPDASAWKAD